MHACLQTHATAFVGQGVDRRLYALTGRNADRAAAAAGRRPRCAAVGLVIRKVHDRKARVMTMAAARRRERIRLYRGVGRARGRATIVAAVKYAARPIEAELDLYTVLEHHPHARGGHGYQPGAACVEIDDDVAVRVAHRALLIPAPHACVTRRQGVAAAAGNELSGQRRRECDRPLGVLARALLHHAAAYERIDALARELAKDDEEHNPIARIVSQLRIST